jgi:hypothetical protein
MANVKTSKTETSEGPRMLSRVTLSNGKTYFVDERLNQLRNIKTPHDYIDNNMNALNRDDKDRVKKCELLFTDFITVRCGKCNQVLFKGTEQQARHLIIYCADCSLDDDSPENY